MSAIPRLSASDLTPITLVKKDDAPTLAVGPGPCSRVTGVAIVGRGSPLFFRTHQIDGYFAAVAQNGDVNVQPNFQVTRWRYSGSRRQTAPVVAVGVVDFFLYAGWSPLTVVGHPTGASVVWLAPDPSTGSNEYFPPVPTRFGAGATVETDLSEVTCRKCRWVGRVRNTGGQVIFEADVDYTLSAKFNPSGGIGAPVAVWPLSPPAGCSAVDAGFGDPGDESDPRGCGCGGG